jgi:nucleoside-diphosphate-sugar epimerase
MVIGGTRFVGLRLVKILAEYGHDITLLNRGKTQVDLPSGVKRLYADRRNPTEISQVLKSQDFEMVCDMTGYQLKNLEPVVVALRDRIGHYIFQSTCAVYAPSEQFPIRENFPTITEVTAPAGEETYALEKLQCEQFLLRMFDENRFPVTIFRSPVIYGPENWMDEREGSYFMRLLRGRRILVPGSGATVLQFVNVDDVARAYLTANGQKKALGGIFNIASEEAITIDGYIDIIAGVMGVTASKVYVEPHVVRNLKRPIFFFPWEHSSIYDISKARDEFGYRPLFNMEEGMRHTYEWWLQNRGIHGTRFIPGKMGYDVDLTYEDDVLARYG